MKTLIFTRLLKLVYFGVTLAVAFEALIRVHAAPGDPLWVIENIHSSPAIGLDGTIYMP